MNTQPTVAQWGEPIFNTPQAPVSQELAHLGPYTRDNALLAQQQAKRMVDYYKKLEMDLRKLCVKIAIPTPKEGINNVELGAGYMLKAKIAYNYVLGDNKSVETALSRFRDYSQEGEFIADRLVTWAPSLSLTEYRKLQDDAAHSVAAARMLEEFSKVLTITEAAPTLEIKEPKKNG